MKRINAICIFLTGLFTIFLATLDCYAANLLNDPGFESSVANGTFPSSGAWEEAWVGGEAGAVCTTTAFHSGSNGLWEYTGTAGTDWWSGPYQDLTANPGEVYIGSAWVRSQSSWVSGSKACVRVTFLDAGKGDIASHDSMAITSPGSDWHQLSVQTDLAPPGTAYVRFRIYLEKPTETTGQSIANFDDCSLEKTIQPILSVSPVTLGFGSDLMTLSFNINNAGDGGLDWTIEKDAAWASVSAVSGATTTETDIIEVSINRDDLELPRYNGTLTVTSNGGNKNVDIFMETVPASSVPSQPSVVSVNGYQLMVRRRLPGGLLDSPQSYKIKGAAWAPASIGTLSDVTSRRIEFGNWYRTDIQMLKEMNVDTVYAFLDFGTTPGLINAAMAVLDYCYQNDIMVIMTVDEDGSDNTANIELAVNAFKNHPAILMWALGNEWNLIRPDRPHYYAHYDSLAEAASAMQANALLIKSLDTNHPVTSILGEINVPSLSDVDHIVNDVCSAVDVWGANIYRGPEFYALFSEWKGISTKPLFLSEFGTDAFQSTSWWPVSGNENQVMQANFVSALWLDLAQELSANDPSKVCLGGTVFEWNDEWWKTPTGSPTVHDPDGFETTWNETAHPDGFANEEWFGIVNVNRERRQVYFNLQNYFSAKKIFLTPILNLILSD